MILPGLRKCELRAASLLRAAFETTRKNRLPIAARAIVDRAVRDLNAANPHARIVWTQALWDELVCRFKLDEEKIVPEEPFWWVILADTACIGNLNGAGINLESFRRHLCAGLRGLSYIGIIDPGLYAYLHSGTGITESQCISWHLHLFVWGATRAEMEARFKKMRAMTHNYRPINPESDACGWLPVNEKNIHPRACYLGKTPRYAYSVGLQRDEKRKRPDELELASYWRPLRPWERVTLFDVLRKVQLPELTVAGGEGVLLRRRALRNVARRR
jgi:hypothetical protein